MAVDDKTIFLNGPDSDSAEASITLDDDRWDKVVEIIGGAAAACFQCGVCTAVCPWALVREKPLPVRTLIRRAQLGLDHDGADLWLCTTCGHCQALCPRGVDIPGVIRSLRHWAWQERNVPEGLPSLMWDIHWDGNPWGQPPSKRFHWADGLDLPDFDPEQHEILLYVGCSSCYDLRLQKVARAFVAVLRAAGVQFGVLGEDEPCCGEAVNAIGQEAYLAEIVDANTRLFAERGVRHIVTLSPHCYDIFATHHPVSDDFRPRHYTQYLAGLIDDGRLELPGIAGIPVTFQDPCYLGRVHGSFEEPRRVLNAIDGIELREMDDNREQGLCCGGGGGRMFMETVVGDRFAIPRVKQAQATGAKVLITACPACTSCLEDGLKIVDGADLRVMDLAEVVNMALTPAGERA